MQDNTPFQYLIKIPSLTDSMAELFARLVRIPKDGSKARLKGSERLTYYQRNLVLRCMQRRAMRCDIPYRLHGTRFDTALTFFWTFDDDKNAEMQVKRQLWDVQEQAGIYPSTKSSKAWGIKKTNYNPRKKNRIMV
jgi:hypothetical protein